MPLSLNLLIAAGVLASAPAPVLARTWPVVAVAGTPAFRPQLRAPAVRPLARTLSRPALKLPRPHPAGVATDEVPEVDIRAKAAWSDDEGFRVTPTRVAFRHRF